MCIRDRYLDAGNNGVMYAGSRKLKASVSSLKDLTVRGYRIRDGHRHQTLAAYRKIYERDQSAPCLLYTSRCV